MRQYFCSAEYFCTGLSGLKPKRNISYLCNRAAEVTGMLLLGQKTEVNG